MGFVVKEEELCEECLRYLKERKVKKARAHVKAASQRRTQKAKLFTQAVKAGLIPAWFLEKVKEAESAGKGTSSGASS